MEITVDVGEVAKAEIIRLEKELARFKRKVDKLQLEVSQLKSNRLEVDMALSRIKDFASDLPSWENNWA